jgi:DNA-binding CsgD family transcriptional regulator
LTAPDLPADMAKWARIHRAGGLSLAGDPESGVASLAGLPADPRQVPTARLDELWVRGSLRVWAGELKAAHEDLRERLEENAELLRHPYSLIRLGYLAVVEYRLGHWDSSLAHADSAASLIADADQVWLLAFGNAVAVVVLAARGRWDEAARHLSEAWRAARITDDRGSINFAANAAVHLAACRGDPNMVVEAAAPIRFATGGAQVGGILTWHIEYASALVSLRRFDEASELLDRMSAQADTRHLPFLQAGVARVRAELAAALRRVDQAQQYFEAADSIGSTVVEPFDHARTRLAYGSFLRRIGERRQAAERLRLARATFHQLKASPFLDRCAGELAACGFSASDAPQPHHLLTPQELAVARLVVSGRTNREVAAQLVLSVKTVGYHLSNIYTKYGVRSRTELAATLQRERSGVTA